MKNSIELINELKAAEAKRQELVETAREQKNINGYEAWNNSAAGKANHDEWCRLYNLERELREQILNAQNREIAVGDGVTIHLYSDAHAGTVVKRTAKTLYVQRDKATLDPSFKPEFIPGGFAAHCTNQEDQTYTYERDENGSITKFNWSEKYQRWFSGGVDGLKLSIGRREFYDYNF